MSEARQATQGAADSGAPLVRSLQVEVLQVEEQRNTCNVHAAEIDAAHIDAQFPETRDDAWEGEQIFVPRHTM